jgi:hypothetical protein
MKRRIFFLLPDPEHARYVVDDLKHLQVDQAHLHIISQPEKDNVYNIERTLWSGNIILFFMAAFVTFVFLAFQLYYFAALTLVIMFTCLILGSLFTIKIPNVHVSEFDAALKHGEVLLIVDAKKQQVHDIDDIVHRRHPEAITGGVGWTV